MVRLRIPRTIRLSLMASTAAVLAMLFPPAAVGGQLPLEVQANGQSVSETLNEVRQLISGGNLTEALDRLERVQRDATALERENLDLQEEFLWQAAIVPLDFAQQLTNQGQYHVYARRSMEGWKEYVRWYDQLTPGQRGQLGFGRDRINKATAHLGNAIVRMEQPLLLFDEYADIPGILYLGPDAIALWKNWLYACPDWVPPGERSASVRRRIICTAECGEQWSIYASTLAEWAREYRLRALVRERYLRETEQINEASQSCGL